MCGPPSELFNERPVSHARLSKVTESAGWMAIYRINPLADPRWPGFVEQHPRSSVFHSREWLEALRRTYGYEPIAFTTSSLSQDLANALLFCRIRSWLTGRRLVSLPFSDHCEPLVQNNEELNALITAGWHEMESGKWRYVEIRPVEGPHDVRCLEKSSTFCFHRLDLRSNIDEIFRKFHKDCIQRKIRRAAREALIYEKGRSERLLTGFYKLQVLTRQRQHMPPQPLSWYKNLIECMGDRLTIHVASKDGKPVAGILTLRHKNTMTYKYGASDRRYSRLGGMQLVLWKAIEEAKGEGLSDLDMGRSDWQHRGVIDFKRRWGSTQSDLTYFRHYSPGRRRWASPWVGMMAERVAGYAIAIAPPGFLTSMTRILYRHIG